MLAANRHDADVHRALRSQVFAAPSPPVAAERFRLDDAIDLHSHDFMELAVVIGGSAQHVSSSGSHELVPGSVIALRPGDWHGFRDCRALEVCNVYIGPEVFKRELSWLRDDGLGAGLVAPWAGGPRMGQLGDRELGALSEPLEHLAGATSAADGLGRGLDDTIRLGYLVVLLGRLIPALGGGSPPTSAGRTMPHPAVRAASSLLEEKPEQRWSLGELAEEVHVSPAYLARLFDRQLGLPPMTYLARLRAERAAALLIETDLSVAEVGRLVGWDDPNYMSRRFRQFFAMAPAAYRSSFRPGGSSMLASS